MKLEIDIESGEAETILFALGLRSKQTKIQGTELVNDAIQLGERLNKTFERAFGWQEYDRMKHYRKPIKRVTITVYDYPPGEE